jgi:hypothetical protein
MLRTIMYWIAAKLAGIACRIYVRYGSQDP